METALQKMGAIRRMADGGLVSPWSLKGIANKLTGPKESVSEKYARQDAERAAKGGGEPGSSPAPKAAPAPNTISGYAAGTAMQAREKAAGLKKGGAIKGPGTGTSDDIPIMASNGEFMIKAKAVKKIGIETLEALNAIADKPDEKDSKAERKAEGYKGGGAIKKMAAGGLILGEDGVYRVNSAGDVKVPGRQYGVTNPRAATPVSTIPAPQVQPDPGTIKVDSGGRATAPGQQYRLGGPATPTPGTALVTTGPGRTFTPPTIPAPQVQVPAGYTPPPVDPKTGAYASSGPATAPPPAVAPQAPSRISAASGAIRNAASKLSSFAGGLAAPLTLGATAGQAALTDTEDYAKRFGLENTQPGLARDLGIRALGAASDLGNTLALGLPKAFLYRDGGDATAAAPAAPVATPAVPNTNRQALQGAAPTAATPAPVDGQVIRNGNSFSGTNVTGNQVSSLDTSQGYAQDLKDLARIDATKAAEQANAVSQEQYAQNAMLQDKALRGNRGAGAIRAANIATATTQRGQDQQAQAQGAIQKLAQQKFGLDAQTAGIDNQLKTAQAGSAAQLLAAQQAVMNAKTPAERVAAEEKMQVLQGKVQKETPEQYAYAPGGQTVFDNQVVTQPGVIYNKQTGEIKGPQAAPKQAQNFEKGKTYTDAKGRKAVWDGQKFVPA